MHKKAKFANKSAKERKFNSIDGGHEGKHDGIVFQQKYLDER